MTLFRSGTFRSHSGLLLPFKIECDALTDDDWAALAEIAAARLRFSAVEGVPQGGLRFAEALSDHVCPRGPLLIADDVYTTGRSMEEKRAGRPAIGVVAFARAETPIWITPVFSLHPSLA